ncbi:N-acetyltransferase family protein [Robbsia andropogonis]|uniref:GNAT family N-acetyltransferase n=1 Tax=Robbsia andropogonis TaxID=28092 RepID=UPI003D1F65D3
MTPSDTAAFQGIRLLGLQEAPAAFGSSYEEEAHRSVDDVASRLTQTSEQAVIGAFVDEALVGVAGVRRQNLLKYRHKAALWGVYVHPGHRGVSISRKLVDAAMAFAQAMPGVMQVTLTVTKGNVAAAGL